MRKLKPISDSLLKHSLNNSIDLKQLDILRPRNNDVKLPDQLKGRLEFNLSKEQIDESYEPDLDNLLKVDGKIQELIDSIMTGKTECVSELCSQWWGLTSESTYCVVAFMEAIKNEKVKK